MLSIQTDASQQLEKAHHLWIQGGRIVAIADRLDNQGLLCTIQQRGWLKSELLNLLPFASEAKQPIGMFMKSKAS